MQQKVYTKNQGREKHHFIGFCPNISHPFKIIKPPSYLSSHSSLHLFVHLLAPLQGQFRPLCALCQFCHEEVNARHFHPHCFHYLAGYHGLSGGFSSSEFDISEKIFNEVGLLYPRPNPSNQAKRVACCKIGSWTRAISSWNLKTAAKVRQC